MKSVSDKSDSKDIVGQTSGTIATCISVTNANIFLIADKKSIFFFLPVYIYIFEVLICC